MNALLGVNNKALIRAAYQLENKIVASAEQINTLSCHFKGGEL